MTNTPSLPDMETMFKTIGTALDAAAIKTMHYFRGSYETDMKDALSPLVTTADLETEEVIRAVLEDAFPEHGILGEEFPEKKSDSPYTWVIDPIDGTIAFAAGKPTYSTLLALTYNGAPLFGAIDQPIVSDRWIGKMGDGTWHNRRKLSANAPITLDEAILSTTSVEYFKNPKNLARFNQLEKHCKLSSKGGDGYAYGLLSLGTTHVIMETGLAWHDAAALTPVVEGAGGRVVDFEGKPIKAGKESYEVLAVSHPSLVDEVFKLWENPDRE